MRKIAIAASLLAAASAGAARAADVTPGLWEITLEASVSGDAGFATGPLSLRQCLTAADARDPSRVIRPLATPGADGCRYTESSYSGSTFRFALDCSGTYGIRSRGSVSFGPTSFDGTMSATVNLTGQAVDFENRISGRRVGDC